MGSRGVALHQSLTLHCSGGYQANNARVISASLINLVQRGFVRNIPL